MKIAVTGATGFVGRYIVNHLTAQGHHCRCWFRNESDRNGFDQPDKIEWVEGDLTNIESIDALPDDCNAVVHAAFWRPGESFQGAEGDAVRFVETNVLGTIRLIEASRAANVSRFVFISTCAVHDQILNDRPLDEKHPLVAMSHYGAHKAAIEKFVHSYGLGHGVPICALRPTGVYGVRRPVEQSKWFELVRKVVAGNPVRCSSGGKEVHAADVARGVGVLLEADEKRIIGECFNCYDRYVSQWDVAQLAKSISGSDALIDGGQTSPKHQIETGKIRALGMRFGGDDMLKLTVEELVNSLKLEQGNPVHKSSQYGKPKRSI